MEQKMIIVDSLDNLPENTYKTITMYFEKSYAVKWYAFFAKSTGPVGRVGIYD